MFAVLAIGCGHSPSFTADNHTTVGPFEVAEPLRLTYSGLTDDQAAFSSDGSRIAYRFVRGSPDGDRCLAVVPSGGGTRLVEACEWEMDEAGYTDGMGMPLLHADGTIAFTRHRGLVVTVTSQRGGLFVGRVDSLAHARELFPLLTTPAGGARRWDDLLTGVWLPDGDLVVVGATRLLTPECKPGFTVCPMDYFRYNGPDTVHVGVELARINIGTGVVTSLAVLEDATAASLDVAGGRAVLLVQATLPEEQGAWHEPLSDTLMVVPIGGGPAEVLTGWPRADRSPSEHLHGVAAGGGRVFVSRSWRVSANDGVNIVSDIAEVMPDGTVVPRWEAPAWRWGRLVMSPDGSRLLAESLEIVSVTATTPETQADLYLIDVAAP